MKNRLQIQVIGLFSLWFCNAFVPWLAEIGPTTSQGLGGPRVPHSLEVESVPSEVATRVTSSGLVS